jgi:cytochrome d ubiquinol oxidase subunit I
MTVDFLARLQFAFTISFHYFFPPMSIGLSVILVLMESMWLKTRNPLYHNMARFWTRIFALSFAIGVPTGIVMEFEFGTNWATYSRFVGDVFGSPLAAEGIFAFFLESGFLAVLLFGWDRVSPGVHFFSTCMVSLGSHFSAIWIVVANSWMQTPAAYHLVRQATKPDGTLAVQPDGTLLETPLPPDYVYMPGDHVRAVVDSFWGMVFNPSSMERLCHVVLAAWLTGAFVVLSISAYYLVRRRHTEFAHASMKVALSFACVTAILQMLSGDTTARGVAINQPLKLAAMEGLPDSRAQAPLGIIGFSQWVRNAQGQIVGVKTTDLNMPAMLSILVSGDFLHPITASQTVVTGLNQLPSDEFILLRHPGATPAQMPALRAQYWPNVPLLYQTYHVMVGVGVLIVVLAAAGAFLWWRGLLWKVENPLTRAYLWIMVPSVLLPQICNQAGWYTAEFGRQPWIVYNLLKTSESYSKSVKADEILISIVGFGLVYAMLFVLFIYLLNAKIHHGPTAMEQSSALPKKWDLAGSRGHIADA